MEWEKEGYSLTPKGEEVTDIITTFCAKIEKLITDIYLNEPPH